MMENLLRAKQVWNLIDPGIREPAVGIAQSEAKKKKLEELRMKDLQVKHYLYPAIDRKLRRDFEVLEMKTNETIPEYFGRVLTISNQMRSNGESMTYVKIVEKILRTLTEKYIYVVVSIEESKDIDQMSIEELQSTLIVHEQKFKKIEQEEEQAFKVDAGDSSNTRGRGRGRYNYRGRGRGRGRQSFNKETIECYNCHKLGHYSYECPNAKEANYAGFEENEEVMLMADGGVEENGFMAHIKSENKGLLWFLDSGCSNHMCGNKERFVDLDQSFSNTVKLGNNTRMTVEGKGNMKLVLNGATYVIRDVYYVPELKNNLLSVGQLQQKGLSFLFQSDLCKVFHLDRGLIFQSRMSTNWMYPLSEDANETTEQKTDECMYSSDDDIAKLWHERLGHISKTGMKTLQHKRMVRDLPEFIVDTSFCEDCMIGKQTKEAIPKSSSWRAGEILELVHSDICGPITPASHAGKKYFLSFIDDYSRKGWVYFLTEKSQAFESFKDFKRAQPEHFQMLPLQEAWSGLKPTVNHFRIWGCLAHVHVPKKKRTKLDNKSCICVLTGHKSWNWNQRKEVQTVEKELSWGNYDFIDDDYILIDEHGVEVRNLVEPDQPTNEPGPSTTLVREGRQCRTPSYLQDYVTGGDLDSDEEEVNAVEIAHHDPIHYEEAVKESKWKITMDREIEMIEKIRPGVARMDTIRLMLALAAQRGWSIYQMDVKSAFLHGTLQENVYVQQPQGYVVKDSEHKVYKLQKALYGLKQAPKAWYSRIEAYFVNEGFIRSKSEHTLFIKRQAGDKLLFVNIYVDDLLFTGNDEKMMEDFKVSMKAEFEMTDLGKM
nr:putative RNA-directed DNA polymerase [Tanacetum cinerariifolium]